MFIRSYHHETQAQWLPDTFGSLHYQKAPDMIQLRQDQSPGDS